jgi:hypothetical protein
MSDFWIQEKPEVEEHLRGTTPCITKLFISEKTFDIRKECDLEGGHKRGKRVEESLIR